LGIYSDNQSKSNLIDLSSVDQMPNLANKPLSLPTGRVFFTMHFGPRQESIIGVNEITGQILKIELKLNPRKACDITGEAEIIKKLNEMGCASCPKLLETGRIDHEILANVLDKQILDSIIPQKNYPYLIQEYITTCKFVRPADLILSLIEQKNLGIYQGDLKPANIRFDEKLGICFLVDYDQAENIDAGVSELNTLEFLYWCDSAENRKYGQTRWIRHFPNIIFDRDLLPLMKNGALNLAETSLYRRQVTTNTPNGVYHSIQERDVYAEGIRNLNGRKQMLDSISFSKWEHILDMGCNAGLLCHYLYDRGCVVVGAEMDESMVLAARIIARITHRNIKYLPFDLDKDNISGKYDTITLFSVLHHTQNVEKNALKIAESCNRIIIECRLVEIGSKPVNGEWHKTTKWRYEDIDDLIRGLEKLFPGFSMVKNYGIGDKNRYVLEFVKRNVEDDLT